MLKDVKVLTDGSWIVNSESWARTSEKGNQFYLLLKEGKSFAIIKTNIGGVKGGGGRTEDGNSQFLIFCEWIDSYVPARGLDFITRNLLYMRPSSGSLFCVTYISLRLCFTPAV